MGKTKNGTRYPEELRNRAVRMVLDHEGDYSSGARDSDQAAIGTEIVASSIKLLAFPAAAGSELLNRVESAGKMWIAGALRDNVLAPKTHKAYSDALNDDAINALEEHTFVRKRLRV